MRKLPNNPNWYDYKMAVVGTICDHELEIVSDKKEINIYADGYTIHVASYKKNEVGNVLH